MHLQCLGQAQHIITTTFVGQVKNMDDFLRACLPDAPGEDALTRMTAKLTLMEVRFDNWKPSCLMGPAPRHCSLFANQCYVPVGVIEMLCILLLLRNAARFGMQLVELLGGGNLAVWLNTINRKPIQLL
jgi:hypothetical protein